MAEHYYPKEDAHSYRIPVVISRDDIRKLDAEAKSQGMTLGYYLDLLMASQANRLRVRDGEPQSPPMARLGQRFPSEEVGR